MGELEERKRSCEAEVESYKRLLHAQGAQQLEVSDSARKQAADITQLYQASSSVSVRTHEAHQLSFCSLASVLIQNPKKPEPKN